MLLPIVHAGEPVLRPAGTRSFSERNQKQRDSEINRTYAETMRGAPGVGLAAPQVGLSLQLAVIEDPQGIPQGYFRRTISAARKAAGSISRGDQSANSQRERLASRGIFRRMSQLAGIFCHRSTSP